MKKILDDGTEIDLKDVVASDYAGDHTPAPFPLPIAFHAPRSNEADLGRYVLLKKLGQGGMGAVYSAYDPQLNRKVAIKLLRRKGGTDAPGGDSIRLLREGQAMARLSHPNVVSVYDLGWCEGRLYVAMELVEGSTLRHWLNEKERSWREILAAFLNAGRGLAAAHSGGLVHRDFKPENVLVGGDGRVCVTDFGLARRAGEDGWGSRLSDSEDLLDSKITRGGAVMGTARYMAPEQFGSGVTDGRSDQFSFCVALYEALFGEIPFRGKTIPARMLEASKGRVIPPPANSVVPRRIHRILTRGLAQKPESRYPSMDALLDDLVRIPVGIRRRWIALGAVVTVGVLAGVARFQVGSVQRQMCTGAERGLVGIWDEARKRTISEAFEATGEPNAVQAWHKVEQTLDARANRWIDIHNQACEAVWVRREETPAQNALRTECLDRNLRELRALTDVFVSADRGVVLHAGETVRSLSSIEVCADLMTLSRHALPDAGITGPEVRKTRELVSQADVLREAGRFQEGKAIAETAVEGARRLQYRALEGEALYQLGLMLDGEGDYRDAEKVFREAERAAESGRHDVLRAQVATKLLFLVGYRAKRPEAGLEWGLRAGSVIERLGGDDVLQADLESTMGLVLHEKGDLIGGRSHAERALQIRERLFGPDHPLTAEAARNLARILHTLGEHPRALALYERDLAIQSAVNGSEHPITGAALGNLGTIHFEAGRYSEALTLHRQSLSIAQRNGGELSPGVADSHHNIGETLLRLGRAEEAIAHFSQALTLYERRLGPDDGELAYPLVGLATAALLHGEAGRSVELARRALRLLPAEAGSVELRAEAHFALARALWASGEVTQAGRMARNARKLYSALGGSAARVAEISTWLAEHG
jgi:tetratricopeptide (TPR) repeat protein